MLDSAIKQYILQYKVYLIKGTLPKLTFIGYLTSKLFTSNYTENTEKSDLNCSNYRQISSRVLSILPSPGLAFAKNLVTTFFEEQEVKLIPYTFYIKLLK